MHDYQYFLSQEDLGCMLKLLWWRLEGPKSYSRIRIIYGTDGRGQQKELSMDGESASIV